MRTRIVAVASLLVSLIAQAGIAVPDDEVFVIRFFASQKGRPTLDQGEGGGNPFASALVELLGRDELSIGELESEITLLTEEKSAKFQTPEVVSNGAYVRHPVVPVPPQERRVALVVVYADYSRSNATSLPGAVNDLKRVARSLRETGFEVQALLDPTPEELRVALEGFASRSSKATLAALYTTGHGGEDSDGIYLLPGDHAPTMSGASATGREIRLNELQAALQASKVNLLFYGGCRNNPLRRYR